VNARSRHLVRDGELDVQVFEQQLEAARRAARDGLWASAADRAQAALSLWLAESYHRAGQHEQARHHTERALA
jgi:hypothetical protein